MLCSELWLEMLGVGRAGKCTRTWHCHPFVSGMQWLFSSNTEVWLAQGSHRKHQGCSISVCTHKVKERKFTQEASKPTETQPYCTPNSALGMTGMCYCKTVVSGVQQALFFTLVPQKPHVSVFNSCVFP